MSYYRPSFSQTVAMSRGSGRGYSSGRGGSSYRGGGGGGGSGGRGSSSWGDRGSSRGSFSSSRGATRYSSSPWANNASSFDSRPRYNSSSGAGNDRYSSTSRGRHDDSSYRRSSYRSDGPNYTSGRDGSTRSPDRKRLRIEAGSSRRSHEGGYGASDGYGGRYDSSQNSYSDRRAGFDERRGAFRPRDDYRKGAQAADSSTAARLSPRGTGYRGRPGPRAARARPLALRDTAPRRRIIDTSSYMRKRGLSTDYFRRVRISRLRSVASRCSLKKSRSSEKDASDKEEENWEDEMNDDDAAAVTSTSKKAKESADAAKPPDDKKDSSEKKSPKKEKDKDKEKEKGGEEVEHEDKKLASEDEERPRSKYTGRPFIPLTCPHCGVKCVRFREYSMHLYSGRHVMAMRKVTLKQKSVLARMRQAQRSAQRELEKNDDALAPRTNFCPLCKLNYRQLKSKHQMSDAHRNMKKFLMPYCRVCHLTFKSPMLYENHICSLDHIKKKAQGDVSNGDKHGSDKEPDSPAEEDLENFTTLDSIGDVDEEEGDCKKTPKPVSESSETSSKPKETINVGVEHVKKVEVYYCDLCRLYLSRHEEEERALRQHCRGRVHLQRYVRYKEDKDLRRQAERIHRKTQEAKEAKEKEKEQAHVKAEAKSEKAEVEPEKPEEKETNAEEDASDDKMWADVDKDLGEILAEVHNDRNAKSSDDEDDGERYDSEKTEEKEDLNKTDPDVKEDNEEKGEPAENAEEYEEEEEEEGEHGQEQEQEQQPEQQENEEKSTEEK